MNTAGLVMIALAEVGVKEQGGNNRGPRIREYQAATWLDGTGWAWCAAFVVWVIRQWLQDAAVRKALKLTTDAQVEAWRPRTAGAWDLANWAREHRLQVLPDTALPKAGDIVLYDFSHCGIVTAISPNGKTIHTVEGNTNGAGDRDSTTGDGVWAKSRPRSLAKAFIRLTPD